MFDFELLLPELQIIILSQSCDLLIQSQRLNHTIRNVTRSAFVNYFKHLKISNQEIEKYIVHYRPSQVSFLFIDQLFKFQQCYRNHYKNIYDVNEYSCHASQNQNSFLHNHFKIDHIYIIRKSQVDLLTLYHICKLRQLESDINNYAKNVAINTLHSIYKGYNKTHYMGLLESWCYLRFNADRFPILPRHEKFMEYKVTLDHDDNVIMVNDQITPHQLMLQLKESCDFWYQQLLIQLNKLD